MGDTDTIHMLIEQHKVQSGHVYVLGERERERGTDTIRMLIGHRAAQGGATTRACCVSGRLRKP